MHLPAEDRVQSGIALVQVEGDAPAPDPVVACYGAASLANEPFILPERANRLTQPQREAVLHMIRVLLDSSDTV